MIAPALSLREDRLLSGAGECELFLGGRPVFENAVDVGRPLRIVVRLPRRVGATGLSCVLSRDEGEVLRLSMRHRGTFGGEDVYECLFRPSAAGLFFFCFFGKSPSGDFFGMRGAAGRALSLSRAGAGAHFQLTVTDFAYPTPHWLLGGIIYHIFVDRFRRTGSPSVRAGAVLNPDWEGGVPRYPEYPGGPLENNDFFGGTLDGITEKLSELRRLGVNCLYLSPIFESASNHRYDTGDYERIDPLLGGEAAFLRLLAAARRHRMRVVLDGVFNHTGSDSRYFNKFGRYPTLGAYQSKASPYFEWYRFSEHPDKYESWWGIDTLPRLSYESPALRELLFGEGGIIARYAAKGIGGFRLDVVDELPDEVVEKIKARLASVSPEAVLFGEVWEDASCKVAYGVRRRYYTGRELDGVMNYPLREGLIAYFRCGDVRPLCYALTEVLPNMPRRIAALTMNLLGTHDTVRVLTALVGEEAGGRSPAELAIAALSPSEYRRGRRLLILAYLSLATLPGIPSIFYGDEVGMEGYADPLNRRPYPWHRRDTGLLSAYRRIGRMRRREPTLRTGGFRLLYLDTSLFVFSRFCGRRVTVTVINRATRGVALRFDRSVTPLYGAERRGERFLLYPETGAVFRTVRGTQLRLCYDDGEELYFS